MPPQTVYVDLSGIHPPWQVRVPVQLSSFTPIDLVTMSMMGNSGYLHFSVGKYSLHSHSFIFGRGEGFRRKHLHMDLTEDLTHDRLSRSPMCEIWNYNSFVAEDRGLWGFMPCWLVVVVVLEDCCACKITVSIDQLTCCKQSRRLKSSESIVLLQDHHISSACISIIDNTVPLSPWCPQSNRALTEQWATPLCQQHCVEISDMDWNVMVVKSGVDFETRGWEMQSHGIALTSHQSRNRRPEYFKQCKQWHGLSFSFYNQYLIVRACKDISKGEEVFNCYGKLLISSIFWSCGNANVIVYWGEIIESGRENV